MARHRAYSVNLMVHYIRTAFQEAGVGWDSDNTAEIHDLVDSIIDAAVEEAVEKVLERIIAAAETHPR